MTKVDNSDQMSNKKKQGTDPLLRMQEAVQLFSLYFRLPILLSRRNEMPLAEFTQRAVFMEKVQPFYGKDYLSALLGSNQQHVIQILNDPLGTYAVILLVEDTAVLFGPFVKTPFQEKRSTQLLSRFTRCDSGLLLQFKLFWCYLSICEPEEVIRAAQSLLEYAGYSQEDFPIQHSQMAKPLKPTSQSSETTELLSWRLKSIQKVEERYAIETELMINISDGKEEASLASLRKLLQTSRPQFGMTVDLWPQESATAIMRNMIRFAAKRSGLNAAVIDGISLDYAQKMRRLAGDLRKTTHLYENMISELCKEICLMKEKGFSSLTQRALYVIQKHYAEALSITDLARSLQVSESTLARSFKADTGHTFTYLLKTERMNAAARLLATTSEPIQVIADIVGVPDQNYFVKIFRSIYQVTPSEYRNLALFGTSTQ